ncbi:MAG: tRNA (adenosine(37)-N6)-dimethylallyltransferase MiaA [Patescibacteria group bacterium]
MVTTSEQNKTPLLVIVGPTASGKSELAVKIARKFDGEIISADSRQIYRGLDIGTGKVKGVWKSEPPGTSGEVRERHIKEVTKKRREKIFLYKGIRHHCIDSAPVRRVFTVADFKTYAERAILDIEGREKLPILCGGTGFWIDAVVSGLTLPNVAPNPVLRKELVRKTQEELLDMLARVDPVRALTIDQKNPHRLIRAIEIAAALGKVPPSSREKFRYDLLWLGLSRPPVELTVRIENRAMAMVRAGLIEEIRTLRKRVGKKRIRALGFEYRAALEYSEGEIGKEELIGRLGRETRQYAKRQTTWWKKNMDIRWIRRDDDAFEIVKAWLAARKVGIPDAW